MTAPDKPLRRSVYPHSNGGMFDEPDPCGDYYLVDDADAALAAKDAEIAELQNACGLYAGDLAAIVRMLNAHDYPHHPEYPNDDEIVRRIAEMGGRYMAQRDEIATLRAQVARLREVIEDATSDGVFGDWHAFIDGYSRPEIVAVDGLCDLYGYGAVMHLAASLWERRAPGEAHTTAACSSVRARWLERARAALTATATEQEQG